MSDVMRWRYGDTCPVVLEIDSATVIEIGDLVGVASNKAIPASSMADAGTKAQNQEAFHDVFVGVAMQRSRSGDTTPIRVATRGVFEFIAVSGTYEVGGLVGPEGTGTSEAVGMANQTVIAVATENLAIGRVAKRGTTVTKVLVDVVGVLSHGGPQAMA